MTALPRMDEESRHLLERLVRLDTTNLEDPVHGRVEKRHYQEACELLVDEAKRHGLAARIWDPRKELPGGASRFGEPRPNVVIDLNRGKPRRLLILSHYDVVPVPDEQLGRWKSPPHTLTEREDGRLYGRGSNDDIGSGVVTGMAALRALAAVKDLPVDVRMVVCCDEETGGAGGIEAVAEHDLALPEGSPERLLLGEMAVLPDGSPYVAAGSSGVTFTEISVPPRSTLSQYLRVAQGTIEFRTVAESWTSALRSPPEPSGPAPHEFITGRATVTKIDAVGDGPAAPKGALLTRVHANSEAANQIPATVTLTFRGEAGSLGHLEKFLRGHMASPFRLEPTPAKEGWTVNVIGKSGHGGYPHRASNPVPEVVRLLTLAVREGIVQDHPLRDAVLTLDLRSPPEMEAANAFGIFEGHFRSLQTDVAGASAVVPPGRARSGYFLSPQDPEATRIQGIFQEVAGRPIGIYGEYGGTDASSLREIRTPSGRPMPAVVLGSMDEDAHMHDAEESIDPRYFREVVDLLVRWVRTA